MKSKFHYKYFLAIIAFTTSSGAFSEEIGIDEVISILSENEMINNPEDYFDFLTELNENPVDINNADRETISLIPFLSEEQIENISYYIYRYGPMVDKSELKLISGIDETLSKLLEPFITISDENKSQKGTRDIKELFKYPKNEIKLSVIRNSAGNDESCLGNNFAETFRYGLKFKDKIQTGFIIQKDGGEKFFYEKKMPDYLSLNLMINDLYRIKRIVFGDFTVNFGQGLSCGKSFSLGKNLSLANPEVNSQEINRHFSSSESGFNRGIGFSLYLIESKNLELSGFGSIRKIDTNLNDSNFTSILETGLHRTPSELENKGNTKYYSTGTHLSYKNNNIQAGLSSVLWSFNNYFDPEYELYNMYYFRGKKGYNLSLDYRIKIKKIVAFGETAICQNSGYAIISGVNFKPFSLMEISVLYRNYAPTYYIYTSGGFSEGGSIRNEKGVYGVIKWNILKNITLNAYLDQFSFPWIKYSKYFITNGNDIAFQLSYQSKNSSNISLRYKVKNEFSYATSVKCKRQIRLNLVNKKTNPGFQSTIDANSYTENNKTTYGLGLTQIIDYTDNSNKINAYFKITAFDAVNYENRLFVYEKSLPGTFSMPLLYGTGCRTSICLKYNLNKNVSLWFKLGKFAYIKNESYYDKKTDMAMTFRLKI